MSAPRPAGRFIAFEGGDAGGKSTQARLLAEGLGAVLTREPGGTQLGAAIRQILLAADDTTFDSAGLDHRAEALMMAADRAQHVATVVRPALDAGRHVVTDRYLYSSVAYQGDGRGLGAEAVRDISLWATGGLLPDLVVLLVVGDDEARARMGRDRDRLEKAGDAFHDAVAASYVRQAADDPQRWAVVDGSGPVEAVAQRVAEVVQARLGLGH